MDLLCVLNNTVHSDEFRQERAFCVQPNLRSKGAKIADLTFVVKFYVWKGTEKINKSNLMKLRAQLLTSMGRIKIRKKHFEKFKFIP